MPLHILTAAACGGLLIAFMPRIRQRIHHLRVVYHVTHTQIRQQRERDAAEVFAYEVNELLDRQRRDTGASLLISHDDYGGTHYDVVPMNQRTHQPRLSPKMVLFHAQHLPIDQQTTAPQHPITTLSQAATYRVTSVYSGIRAGSFGRPDRARTTRILTAWTGNNGGDDDDAA